MSSLTLHSPATYSARCSASHGHLPRRLRAFMVLAARLPLQLWWPRHLYNNTVADMVNVIDYIYDNAPPFQSLQVAGYCYGGGVAAGLTAVERPRVRSAVSAHPTWEDLQGRSELGVLEQRVNTSTTLFFIMVRHTHSHTAQAHPRFSPALSHAFRPLAHRSRMLLSVAIVCCVHSRKTIRSSTTRPSVGSTHPLREIWKHSTKSTKTQDTVRTATHPPARSNLHH